ncbi:glycosyltransferase family 2 protein [Chitinophaga sp.]|uniref:glycosyltransferase family 2 protein n=1 Tax=Chitinophaga sp. TaxID=1869181 RepID=UPI0031CEEF60
MTIPAISICIPAYRQPELLQRCLNSIHLQALRDFEVIITDDSPDNSVQQIVETYRSLFPLTYQHNPVPLGSPENWNAALLLASGRYVKMMHQDDWFAFPDSLSKYYAALEQHPEAGFAFSASTDVGESGPGALHQPQQQQLNTLAHEPECLLLGNFIGAPSTGIFRRQPPVPYDGRMKWLVDIDQYIQLIYHNNKVICIPEPLVNIGVHSGQVTQAVQHNAAVVIGEHLLLLSKLKQPVLRRLPYFDFCWRLLRNHGVRSVATLEQLAGEYAVPRALRIMAGMQAVVPQGLLKNGLVSKCWMLLAYGRSLFSS